MQELIEIVDGVKLLYKMRVVVQNVVYAIRSIHNLLMGIIVHHFIIPLRMLHRKMLLIIMIITIAMVVLEIDLPIGFVVLVRK